MANHIRMSERACLSISEVKQALYRAGADKVFTPLEISEISGLLDYAYWLAEEADTANAVWEFASKRGVEAALNRPNRDKVVSLAEHRLRKEAKQREAATDGGPDAA